MYIFFFKQKTAYEIGTGDWSSDVCSSDLALPQREMVSKKSGGAAATRTGQYKIWALPQREMGSIKCGALLQREMGSIKCRGAAATRTWQYKKQGAAATRNGQYKKRGAAATRKGQ